ncbi:hypothetical protein [Leptolyngbya sp. FACHB-16]|nr:hypothetical protein [Leptolyngbya sp. FACHB-16]
MTAIAQWTAYFLRAHVYQDREACQRINGSDRPHSWLQCLALLN